VQWSHFIYLSKLCKGLNFGYNIFFVKNLIFQKLEFLSEIKIMGKLFVLPKKHDFGQELDVFLSKIEISSKNHFFSIINLSNILWFENLTVKLYGVKGQKIYFCKNEYYTLKMRDLWHPSLRVSHFCCYFHNNTNGIILETYFNRIYTFCII